MSKLWDTSTLTEAATAGRVRENWERLKKEQEGREGVFHDVPETLPALLLARKVQRRAAAAGFDYPDLAGALGDLDEELAELRAEIRGESIEIGRVIAALEVAGLGAVPGAAHAVDDVDQHQFGPMGRGQGDGLGEHGGIARPGVQGHADPPKPPRRHGHSA